MKAVVKTGAAADAALFKNCDVDELCAGTVVLALMALLLLTPLPVAILLLFVMTAVTALLLIIALFVLVSVAIDDGNGGGNDLDGISIGTSGSRRQSSVGRGARRGMAGPYVIKMSSSAGNITNIPGRPHVTW